MGIFRPHIQYRWQIDESKAIKTTKLSQTLRTYKLRRAHGIQDHVTHTRGVRRGAGQQTVPNTSNGANPLDSSICHNLLEAARRNKPVSVKKAPISADIIKSIIDKFAGPSANLKDMRVACICSLGFAGFFRYDELSNIAPSHLEFFPDHLRVFVPRAKNDIYREGNYVYIKRLGNKYCPVALLEGYISMCGIELSSSVALFRPVRFFKSTNTYKLHGVKLSYTRCREIFKEYL